MEIIELNGATNNLSSKNPFSTPSSLEQSVPHPTIIMPNAKRKRTRNTSSSTTSTRKHRNDSIEPIIQKGLVSLRRTGKLVRSFHCQKLVRKLKQYKEQPTKEASKIQQMEERLEIMKTLDLTKLVQICSHQLSLPSLTKNAPSSKSSSPSSNDSIHHPTTLEISSLEHELLHQLLQHKQLQSCLSTLQNSLQSFHTSHQRRLELKLKTIPKKQRKKEEKLQRREERYERELQHGNNGVMDYSGASGLFIASLAGSTKEEDDDKGGGGDEYEEGEDPRYTGAYDAHREPPKDTADEAPPRKRKNRKGSRARRAKALAIQAREEGRSWETSMNWRSKNQHNEEEETTSKKKTVTASEVAETGKDWKSDGTAHPSWLAKQRQTKEGIVAFKGTKITFD